MRWNVLECCRTFSKLMEFYRTFQKNSVLYWEVFQNGIECSRMGQNASENCGTFSKLIEFNGTFQKSIVERSRMGCGMPQNVIEHSRKL